MGVDPPGRALSVALAPGSHTFGKDIPVGIFPAALKDNEHLGAVVALICFLFAETRTVNSFPGRRHEQLIVELQGLGPAGKRHAHFHLAVRIRSGLDRLEHLAKEHRPGHKHLHIHHTYHLAMLIQRGEFGALSRTVNVGKHSVRRLGHAHWRCKHIRRGPWRPAKICIRLACRYSLRGAYLIYRLVSASKELRFLDFTCDPLVEIAEINRLNLFSVCRRRGCGTQYSN